MEEEHSKTWIGIAAILAVVIGITALWLFSQKQPVIPGIEEGDAPVVSPAVEKLEDLAEFTRGRPMPAPTAARYAKIYNDDHIRGNLDAEITLFEISSLHNRYSGLMHPALADLVQQRNDVKWIFRHFPDENDPLEEPASYASECVYLQKGHPGFWNYLDLSSPYEIKTEKDVIDIGVLAGADRAELEKCMEDKTTVRDVAYETMLNIQEADPTSIPTFLFLNDKTNEIRYMQGADTMEFVNRVLDDMTQK